jgi:hypothetical protein
MAGDPPSPLVKLRPKDVVLLDIGLPMLTYVDNELYKAIFVEDTQQLSASFSVIEPGAVHGR